MKDNPLLSFSVFSLLMMVWLGTSAQDTTGHWLWSQKYTGHDDDIVYYNKIINMETDAEGNIYYFGECGSDASLGNAGSGGPMVDGVPSSVDALSKSNLWIAKYTHEGEKVWSKLIGMCRFSCALNPGWMELHNDTLYITGEYTFEHHAAGGRWMWFYDTLITSDDIVTVYPDSIHRPPFVGGKWTFFTKMDLDGNVINTFFARELDRVVLGDGHRVSKALGNNIQQRTPIHVDQDGNIYYTAPFCYTGSEEIPYTIVVYNGDSTWNYDFYLDGDYEFGNNRCCWAIYKFSPEGKPIWQKRFFEQTENVPTVYDYWCAMGHENWVSGDETMPNFTTWQYGFAADEDDNLYISGFIAVWSGNDTYDNSFQCPIRLFADSTHWVEIGDLLEAKTNIYFLLKTDTSGTIQYLCQPRKIIDPNINHNMFTSEPLLFRGLSVSDSSVYVIGQINSPTTDYVFELADGVFFDRTSYPDYGSFPMFLRYDKETGALRNYGIGHLRGYVGNVGTASTEMALGNGCYEQNFVSGNRLFMLLGHLSGPQVSAYYIGQWCTDGTFIDTIPLHRDTHVRENLLQPQPNGDLLAAFQTIGEFSLGDDFYPSISTSSALFGVYHNDIFAYPHVGIDDFPTSTSQQPAVSLYPNPGVDFVTVQLHRPDDSIRTVEVFDLNGRKVLSTSQSTVNIAPLPSGAYLFRITTADNVFHTKFVKERL